MSEAPRGVILPSGETGSTFFHRILKDAVERFPAPFAEARFPTDASDFKRSYAKALTRFEAARVASPERVEVARHMVSSLHRAMQFRGPAGTLPLGEHLVQRHPGSVVLRDHTFAGRPGLVPTVTFGGKQHVGAAGLAVARDLHRQHHMSDAAMAALAWIFARAEADGGALDLRGERFVLMGAGAELAPTAMLLRGGATVLWLDVSRPDGKLPQDLAGRLVVPDGAGDLLSDPLAAASAITQFAAGLPVHLGLFAYAPGKGRELRLGTAMDAIVRSLAPEIVKSVVMFVSPTVPAEVQPEDVAFTEARLARLPMWQAALQRSGALTTPGHLKGGAAPIAHAVVALQGPTYQAAQYVAKMASAEVYATHGIRLDATLPRPVTTSANIAGIADTKSLDHPLFQAAFIGAPSFGVRVFEPGATRSLSTLLVLHDLLNPQAASAAGYRATSPTERARALAERQLHGGVNNLPWVFDSTIRASAVLGLAKRPRLAVALARPPRRSK